jgi:hypothetical protein
VVPQTSNKEIEMTGRKNKQNRKQFHVERLEGRDLMAGDVLAFVSSGHLHVVEASGEFGQGQAVAVSQLSDGRLRVKGLASQDGGVSLVNGRAFQDFRVTGDLKVNLGGGRDTLKLVRNTAIKGISIDMSASNADPATDVDAVIVDGIRTDNNLSIKTGAGADFIDIYDSIIGNGVGIDNLSIDTGSGRDHVDIFSNDIVTTVKGNLSLFTFQGSEADVDHVFMETLTVHKNLSVATGAGNDSVEMTDIFAGGDIVVSTDKGADTVKLRELRSGDDFWVLMGDNNDTLIIDYLRADELLLDGGAGIDKLSEGIPGNSSLPRRKSLPEGEKSRSPGSRSAPWVFVQQEMITPKALHQTRCNAFGVMVRFLAVSQGALRDPGL